MKQAIAVFLISSAVLLIFTIAQPAQAQTNNATLQTLLQQEAGTALGTVASLTTALDPTITDVAVTDAQLATAGVTLNTVPTLINDPSMLIFDDDKMQCPNAQFTSINAAVLAASPGATIRVCPGVYRESVLVDKALTLQAPRQQGTATECQAPIADDPTQEAIVLYNNSLNGGNPSEGFDVESSNVTIDGFKVEPDSTLVTHDGVGIFTSRFFSGYDIRHNVVQNNTIGIYVNSTGSAPTNVHENCSRSNNLRGAASGNGIYSDQGLSNAQITNNYITGDQSNAIVIDTFLTAPHDIAITHNQSVTDGAIVTFASSGPAAFNLTVDYNKSSSSVGSGIVTFNVTTSEYAYNDVENGTFNGVSLHETINSAVKSNKAIGFKLSGVRIGDGSDNNTVATNRSENNVEAGLAATNNSTGNTIQQNHMNGNTPDCYDDTFGGGTAGTANLWINDFGMTESRPGLCKHATP